MDKSIAVISKIDIKFPHHASVTNKNTEIAMAFTELGYECTLFNISNGWFSINQKQVEKIVPFKPLNFSFIEFCRKYVDPKLFDIIWIRHNIFSFNFLTFLKNLKQENSKLTILYEIPTYPYIYEFKHVYKLIIKLQEKLIMTRLVGHIDFILGGFDRRSLFNVPIIKVTNGITIKNYDKICNKTSSKTINLLVSGVLWNWYGIDRIIEGLKKYTGNDIQIHVIGEGNDLEHLKKLVLEYSLSDIFSFYGWLDKSNVDNLEIPNCIGIGTLASFRKKLSSIYSLKHREFCARGMPFIYSGFDSDFDEKNCSFIYKVPLNDDPIEIDAIVQWYRTLKSTPEEIRNYAIQNLDWKVKIQEILNAIK